MKKLIVSIFIMSFIYQINAQSNSGDTIFIELSDNSVALGNLLKSLMPQMVFTSSWGASLEQTVKEEDVIENILMLIKQGVRIDSLRIINFKNSTSNGFSVSSGEFGRLVSVKDRKNGMTLIEYCEAINCLKIAKVFIDEISKINDSSMTTSKELLGLKLRAETGDVNSQMELGNKLRDGVAPFEKDYVGAMKWFQMASDKGSALGQYSLAYLYTFKKTVKDYDKAFALYLKSSEQGNSDALNMVGMCYSNGIGVAVDQTEALKWWIKASEKGNSKAQANLGASYERGEGVSQDCLEAIKWYTKAAEQGNADAQGSLGVMYFKGKCVPKDYNEAEKWLIKCAEQGNETCKGNLEYIRTQMEK